MNKNSIDKIVIVGGGTAGWLTALYANLILPQSKIIVIESEEIGILGAGEGTTPQIIDFLDYLGIPTSKFIKEASCTIKNGIKFTNWKNDNEYYYHNFNLVDHRFAGDEIKNNNGHGYYNNKKMLDIYQNVPRNSQGLINSLNEENKVSHVLHGFPLEGRDPILSYTMSCNFALHFNATSFASVLKEIALTRNIILIEGKVKKINCKKNNDIESLTLESEEIIKLDFVFDCTGFSRLIIGKHYKSKWISYSDKLPVNSAIPFFIEIDNKKDIPPFTESIAMKYGWMWKIPTQERYGCGYVYDSSLISEEDAVKEIEEYLGFQPIYPRKNKGSFKFDAGYYKNSWTNNCIALGLSSGFIEPLEATSIMSTIESLKKIFSNIQNITIRNNDIIKSYNNFIEYQNNNILDFIYFHYMSGRKDTEFWKKFTIENATESLKEIIFNLFYFIPENTPLLYSKGIVFKHNSWFEVGLGIGAIKTHLIEDFVKSNDLEKFNSLNIEINESIKQRVKVSTPHNIFLKSLGAKI